MPYYALNCLQSLVASATEAPVAAVPEPQIRLPPTIRPKRPAAKKRAPRAQPIGRPVTSNEQTANQSDFTRLRRLADQLADSVREQSKNRESTSDPASVSSESQPTKSPRKRPESDSDYQLLRYYSLPQGEYSISDSNDPFENSSKKNKSSYAVDFKLCVTEWFINNGMDTRAAAEKFQIHRKQVLSWYKMHDKLKAWAAMESSKHLPSRRLAPKNEWSRYRKLDEHLFDRCVQTVDPEGRLLTVNNSSLKLLAESEASKLGYTGFKASYSWLKLWKVRVQIKYRLTLVLKNRIVQQWRVPEEFIPNR